MYVPYLLNHYFQTFSCPLFVNSLVQFHFKMSSIKLFLYICKDISICKYNDNSKYYSGRRMIKEKHLKA